VCNECDTASICLQFLSHFFQVSKRCSVKNFCSSRAIQLSTTLCKEVSSFLCKAANPTEGKFMFRSRQGENEDVHFTQQHDQLHHSLGVSVELGATQRKGRACTARLLLLHVQQSEIRQVWYWCLLFDIYWTEFSPWNSWRRNLYASDFFKSFVVLKKHEGIC